MTLTHGELFAGIGGFGLAFSRVGIQTKWCVEINENCQAVLRRHNPGIPILGDIRDCGAHNLEPVDIISFGSPCQDLSVAGKREGLNGERSGLFYEAIRILGELKPAFGLWENVPGALSSHSGRDFAAVLAAFRDIGARDIAWTCLDAQYFGVAQRRRRVFVVADFRGERAAEVLFEREGGAWDPPPSREEGQRVADPLTKSFAKHHGASAGKDSLPRNHIITGQCHGSNVGPMGELRQGNGHVTGGVPFVTYSIQHSIIGRRAEAGAQGKGWRDDGTTWTLDSRGDPDVVAFDRTQASVSGDVAGPLRACGAQADGVNDGKADAQCVAYGVSENQRAEVRLTDYSRQISSGGGKPGQGYPCVAIHATSGEDISPALKAEGSDASEDGRARHSFAVSAFGVRRLTPTEAERLQGFPDGHTGDQSDTQRYKQLGNAVAVPVVEWLGRRIAEMEAT